MPTTDKVPIFEFGSIDRGYQAGFAEGVDLATPRIWNEAIESAAELADAKARQTRSLCFQLSGETVGKAIAAAIRKLKKP